MSSVTEVKIYNSVNLFARLQPINSSNNEPVLMKLGIWTPLVSSSVSKALG